MTPEEPPKNPHFCVWFAAHVPSFPPQEGGLLVTSEGLAVAQQHGCVFYETSAKTNLNVEQALTDLAKEARRRQTNEELAKAAQAKGQSAPSSTNAPNGRAGVGRFERPLQMSSTLLASRSHLLLTLTRRTNKHSFFIVCAKFLLA